MHNQFNVSFEFFPPKTPQGFAKLNDTANQLLKFKPNFFSVTYGAGGSTHTGTIETVKQIQETTQLPVAPHLSCIGATKTEIVDLLNFYKKRGINRIVALRGDLPSGMGNSGEFKYASELVAVIREATGKHFHIEVAAYPECHPQAKDAAQNLLHLKSKVDAGADSAITQYFYNPDAYFYFRDMCDKHGISIPIIPGIMPIGNPAKLEQFSNTCGAEIPRWLRTRLACYEQDEESLKSFCAEAVYTLCEQLLRGGAPGFHFYTLNRADLSAALCERLQTK